ncbi:MAG: sodium:proton antiporter [Clostridia bacterium]|nr:sodium:proton antiporter [Clostridia bacterium]
MPESKLAETAAASPAPPWEALFTIAAIAVGVLMALCLLRAISGRRTADRVIAINMLGTHTVIAIGLLALIKQEGYLIDVALIYTMLSFLAVVVLSRLSVGAARAAKNRDQSGEEEAEDA